MTSETVVVQFLEHFVKFPFNNQALVIGGNDVTRICHKHPLFIHPFIDPELLPGQCAMKLHKALGSLIPCIAKFNVAASLSGSTLHGIVIYFKDLLVRLRDMGTSENVWAQFLPLPKQVWSSSSTILLHSDGILVS